MKLSQEIQVLQEIARALVRVRNVREQLVLVLDILHERMGMLRGTFTLLEGDELRIEASTKELNSEEKALGRYRIGEGVTGMVAKTGRPEIVRDIREDGRFLNRTGVRSADEGVSFICVPLYHHGQVIGTLSVDRKIDSANTLEQDVVLLEVIANLTAEAAAICREECAERDALAAENRRLHEIIDGAQGELVGNCRKMHEVYRQIRQVAPTEATVLIRGASGTGKELVARAIKDASNRSKKPFVTLNCAALPENLVESELFGHEKGAFTDAFARRIGRAEAADGGTLFLDEIGDLPVSTQVKLLRFLQERTFSRVGSNEELHSDVRFIAATSRNLEELIERKLFREDLYYRLSVFPVMLPPLAERANDIVLLAEHFIGKMNEKYSKSIKRISPPAMNCLLAYNWPGNVRELENCIERAVLTAVDDTIHTYNLPPTVQTDAFAEDPFGGKMHGRSLAEQLEACEKRIISEALERHGGNQTAAGKELSVSPRMMTYRIKRLGL
ncbi:MAG: sigma 54-interacting transcriptional regulator [Kiritimatiellae bacterium]|nr:sigma 54-interacting transcriptional regulator [Kiritimatiellia bacterium]